MDKKSGKVSVTTENIFPGNQTVALRGQGYLRKRTCIQLCRCNLKAQETSGAWKGGRRRGTTDYSIRVVYDDDAKTIAFEDDGVGMTEEEVEKYINQIAFSGAL